MSNLLPYRVDGPLRATGVAGAPEIDRAAPGVRIAAVDVARGEGELAFTLVVSYGFPGGYFSAFKDIKRAITAIVQSDRSGAVAAIPMLDPGMNDFEPIIENYRAPADAGGPVFMRGSLALPLAFALPAEDAAVHVRAVIHEHLSNALVVGGAKEEP